MQTDVFKNFNKNYTRNVIMLEPKAFKNYTGR